MERESQYISGGDSGGKEAPLLFCAQAGNRKAGAGAALGHAASHGERDSLLDWKKIK